MGYSGKIYRCIHIWLWQFLMFIIDVYQASYIVDEVKDKTGKDIDVSSWKKEFVEDLPEQQNGFVSLSYAIPLMNRH